MKKYFVFVGILMGCWMGILGQAPVASYEPGEIIVQYEPIAASRQVVRGSEILVEHRNFLDQFSRQFRLQVSEQKPAFASVVDHMVKEDLTEDELHSQIRERQQSRRGITLSQTLTSSSYQFARTLRLWVDSEDLEGMVDNIRAQAASMVPSGYKLTEVSLNYRYKSTAEPNDPLFSQQYAHALTGASTAWERTRGDGSIIIGVIDSGIDPTHEDLVGNIVPGSDFVDRRGLESWQRIAGEDYTGPDSDPNDFDGHGTHVSGVIAAKSENDKGLSGVCPECKIMPLRAFALWLDEETDDNGNVDTLEQSTTNILEASEALIFAVENGADIVNMSFAGETRWGQTFTSAMRFARDNGVVMIAAAANENVSTPYYPAAFDDILAVASTDENDRKSSFSNYGTWVDVSAPGSNILSTVPTNGRWPSEALTELSAGERDLSALPLTFTGFTENGIVQAPLAYVGLARAQDVNNADLDWDLEGKIALIERGQITFKEKVDRVKSFGAIGAIIYNNVAGNFGGTLQEPQNNPIPAVSISQAEGRELRSTLTNSNTLEATLRIESFTGYFRLDGTSFAAPYVAGMAGLILADDPSLSIEEVKEKILNSVDNIDAQNPGFVGQLGTGRVNLANLFPATVTDSQDQLTQETFSVYPNPTQDFLVVENPAGARLNSLRLLNAMGQVVSLIDDPNQLIRPSITLELADLPTGWYIVQGYADSQRWHAKVLKQD